MSSKKKRTTGKRRKTALKRTKRQSKPTVGALLKRLEMFFKVTDPSITTLIAEANGRAARAEKKFKDLEARVERLTNCLTEDQLEAAYIMRADPLTYIGEFLKLSKEKILSVDQSSANILAPYAKDEEFVGSAHQPIPAEIVPLYTMPKATK